MANGKHEARAQPVNGQSRYGAILFRETDRAASFGDCEAILLQEAIEAVTQQGDAVMFARTSDGGALSIRILSGGKTYKFYPTCVEELVQVVGGMISAAR